MSRQDASTLSVIQTLTLRHKQKLLDIHNTYWVYRIDLFHHLGPFTILENVETIFRRTKFLLWVRKYFKKVLWNWQVL